MILEVEEIRKMLCRIREDSEQSRREITEEKNQIKWMNFCAKKKRRVLAQQDSRRQQEKTLKERDELEIVKINIQLQREEVEQKLQNTNNCSSDYESDESEHRKSCCRD